MDEFLSFAGRSDQLKEGDLHLLHQLLLEARRANAFLESSPTNLADIRSFAEMADRLALADGTRADRLRYVMQRVYATPGSRADTYLQRYQEPFRGLLGLDAFSRPMPAAVPMGLSFITTNYDHNIDSACHALGFATNPVFAFVRRTETRVAVVGQLGSSNAGQSVPPYKPHGSVNWYAKPEEQSSEIDDQVVAVERRPRGASLPLVCAADYLPPGSPLIVPPSFLKPEVGPKLRSVWKSAAQALAGAHVVAFVYLENGRVSRSCC
jgi:hypothetical protein